MVMGMRNRLAKPHEWIHKNPTGCLQKYVVLQYERIIKHFILNTNDVLSQIIAKEHNFEFHRTSREICAIGPSRSTVWSNPLTFFSDHVILSRSPAVLFGFPSVPKPTVTQ
jgi:hypothetical protein